jgi:hypothetical protein
VAEKANILEGLHVLLVTEDDVRAAALTRSLRDLKAIVGDVKAGAKDPLALRGADLLVVDARSASSTKARVAEMRSDVRARWASRVELDYEKLVMPDGAILLKPLEEALAPLVTADKDLTEQARRQDKLSLKLSPLGPSRLLRALAAAGPTMQVEFKHETLTAEVTLSNELLVSAFAERGTSERWEAWAALVRILGLPDATVSVARRSHPSAMNIMEPIDQALEVAAQERQSSAALIAVEELSAQARIEEMADSMEIAVVPEKAVGFKRSATAGKAAPRLDRTLMGVTPGLPAPLAPPPNPVALKSPEASRYTVTDNAAERVKPGRTLMGIAPGALPALGAAPKARAEFAAKVAPPPPPPPAPVEQTVVNASPFQDTGTSPTLGLPPELLNDNPTVKVPALTDASHALSQGPANDVSPRATINLDVGDLGDDDSNEQTLIADSAQLRELAKQSGDGGALEALLDIPDTLPPQQHQPPYAPKPAPEPVDTGAKTQLLMAVIDEAVEASPVSHPPGAKPVLHFGAPADPEDTILIARMSAPARSRALFLGILLALAIVEAVVVVFVDRWQRAPEEEKQAARINSVHIVAAPGGKSLPRPMLAAPSQGSAKDSTSEINAATPAEEANAGATTAARIEAKGAPAAPATAEKPGAMPKPELEPATAAVAKITEKPVEPALAAIPAKTDEAKPAAPVAPIDTATVTAKQPAPRTNEATEGKTPVAAAAETPAVADDLETLIRTGLRALSSRNTAQALSLFERAVAIDPRNPHAQGGLAESLLGVGRLTEAQTAVDAAIKLRPRRAHYRVTQGDILKAKGDPEGAKAAWEKALEINPEDRDALARLK